MLFINHVSSQVFGTKRKPGTKYDKEGCRVPGRAARRSPVPQTGCRVKYGDIPAISTMIHHTLPSRFKRRRQTFATASVIRAFSLTNGARTWAQRLIKAIISRASKYSSYTHYLNMNTFYESGSSDKLILAAAFFSRNITMPTGVQYPLI